MTQASSPTETLVYTAAIDFEFIHALEQAGDPTTACVPMLGQSNSGVTVAHGVDIGQMSMERLAGLALSRGLIEKLAPYVGLKQHKAAEALENAPLTLTEKEVTQLDRAVYGAIIKDVADRFDAQQNASPEKGWTALPSAAATVVVSLAVQYGPNLAHRTPRFWTYALTHNWMGMITELVDFGDAYSVRRHREAAYLKHHMFGKSDCKLQEAANDPD
ncbi:pesticin C-terminus-like muramidase [Larsenimonas salina]|uniref:pesticin C-terminus-like muramidase n=1 Tax=Larsenimonas salina TaxID=1295565 RepID=UPI002072D2EC|nr:pesticin C-terminus-like muramidase [Larsenimonas salina]MCM5705560.1 pesticin C-terminus-like muramidase [Larsenimonas salina]